MEKMEGAMSLNNGAPKTSKVSGKGSRALKLAKKQKIQSTLRNQTFLDLISAASPSGISTHEDSRDALQETSNNTSTSKKSLILLPGHCESLSVAQSSQAAGVTFASYGGLLYPIHALTPETQLAISRQHTLRSLGMWKIPDSTESTFYPTYTKKGTIVQEGTSIIGTKIIEAGFNVRVLFRSRRLYQAKNTHIIRYKLHGNHQQFSEFVTNQNQRHKDALHRVVTIFDNAIYPAPRSCGFEKLAEAFFSGQQVFDMEHYEAEEASQRLTANENHQVQNVQSDKPYQVSEGNDWQEVLNIVTRNNLLSSGPFMTFLRDLVMNSDLEAAARKRSSYYGFKVFSQSLAIQNSEKELRKMQDLAPEDTMGTDLDPTEEKVTANTPPAPPAPTATVQEEVSWSDEELILAHSSSGKKHSTKKGKYSKASGKKGSSRQPKQLSHEPDLNPDSESIEDVNSSIKTSDQTAPATNRGIESNNSFTGRNPDLRNGGEWKEVQSKSTRKVAGSLRISSLASDRVQSQGSNHARNSQGLSFAGAHSNPSPNIPLQNGRPSYRQNAPWVQQNQPSNVRSANFSNGRLDPPSPQQSIGNSQNGNRRPVQAAAVSHAKSGTILNDADFPAMVTKPATVDVVEVKTTGPKSFTPIPGVINGTRGESPEKDSANNNSTSSAIESQPTQSEEQIAVGSPKVGDVTNEDLTMASERSGTSTYSPTASITPGQAVLLSSASVENSGTETVRQASTREGSPDSPLPLGASHDTQPSPTGTVRQSNIDDHDLAEEHSRTAGPADNYGTSTDDQGAEIEISSTAQNSNNEEVITPIVNEEVTNGGSTSTSKGEADYSVTPTSDNTFHAGMPPENQSNTQSSIPIAPEPQTYPQPIITGYSQFVPQQYEQYNHLGSASAMGPGGYYSANQGRNAYHENNYNIHNPSPYYSSQGHGAVPAANYQDPGLQTSARFAGHGHPDRWINSNLNFGSAGYHSLPPELRTDGHPFPGNLVNGSQINGPSQCYGPHAVTVFLFDECCNYCREPLRPSIEAPVILCPGCGPMCNIRYCSIACLLVDALDHSAHCMQRSASQRLITPNLLPNFSYEHNPIFPIDGNSDPPYRFRQKAFAMFCNSGPFPELNKTWAKKFPGALVAPGFDEHELIKKTGDYAIFRSEAPRQASWFNPNADLIFTINLNGQNLMKQALNRSLKACFLRIDARVVRFLYRLIVHFILDEEYFERFKYTEPAIIVYNEFKIQFKEEFGFDSSTDDTIDSAFDFGVEYFAVDLLLRPLEYSYPVL